VSDTAKGDRAWLVLADGTVFEGTSFGARGTTTGEAVFTTTVTGYQEVLTDPSYCGQIVTMTAPEIGNVGINADDSEAVSDAPRVAGFVVRDLSPIPSNWRAQETLEAYLTRHGVVGITEVDTRKLTRHLRDHGSQNAAIGTESPDALLGGACRSRHERARSRTRGDSERALFVDGGSRRLGDLGASRARASRGGARFWSQKEHSALPGRFGLPADRPARRGDCGRGACLAARRDLSFERSWRPGRRRLRRRTLKGLLGKKPIFGICLGHQLLARALGAKTYKLKFGHRGANQPVKDLATGRVEITTQNHGFCVDLESLPSGARSTHVHLNDATSEGLAVDSCSAFSVQYHPEAAAGPHDALYLFERFVNSMRSSASAQATSR
jgi:carbamoyl-phosphate synthase small subunit